MADHAPVLVTKFQTSLKITNLRSCPVYNTDPALLLQQHNNTQIYDSFGGSKKNQLFNIK